MSVVRGGHPQYEACTRRYFGVRLSPPVHRDSVAKVSQHVEFHLTFRQCFRAHDGDPSFHKLLFIFEISLKTCKVSVPVSLKASNAAQMRVLLFRNVTQRRLVVIHRCFGTTPRSPLQRSSNPLKMGLTGCPEPPVNNHQFTLRNIPEELRSHAGYSV